MELKAVAKKPQLISRKLEDDHILNQYGEPLEFFMYDRYSVAEYIRISQIDQTDYAQLLDMVYDFVLDANGNRMLTEDDQLPPEVMIDMINSVVEQLGNSASQTSKTKTAA